MGRGVCTSAAKGAVTGARAPQIARIVSQSGRRHKIEGLRGLQGSAEGLPDLADAAGLVAPAVDRLGGRSLRVAGEPELRARGAVEGHAEGPHLPVHGPVRLPGAVVPGAVPNLVHEREVEA